MKPLRRIQKERIVYLLDSSEGVRREHHWRFGKPYLGIVNLAMKVSESQHETDHIASTKLYE